MNHNKLEDPERDWTTRPTYLPPEKKVYAGQELDMEQWAGSKLGKEYVKAVYCHPAYLTYVQSKYIIWNVGLDEAQARIKIGGRNVNNLWYADDITLMAESKEELKSLLMKVKEENEKLA